jgi:hypothetical protein
MDLRAMGHKSAVLVRLGKARRFVGAGVVLLGLGLGFETLWRMMI